MNDQPTAPQPAPKNCRHCGGADNVICAGQCKDKPAQQEPVGCEGAVVNGRVYADRLEHDYKFECEAGPLHMCTDWVEFRRCFEWLAQHTAPPAQRTWVGLTDAETKHLWEVSRAAIPRYQTFKTLIKKTLKERNT